MIKVGLFIFGLSMVGCASSRDKTSPPEPVEAIPEALSNHENCGGEGADAEFSSNIPQGAGPPSRVYGHTNCVSGWLLDLNQYVKSTAGTGGNPPIMSGVEIKWTETIPDNQTDCQNAQALLYVWDWDHPLPDGSPGYLGARSASGRWVLGMCAPPQIDV